MAKKRERKLSLDRLFAAMDLKRRDFLESLDDDERKEFSAFLSLRYISCVEGSADLQSWYLMAANEYINKHFTVISRHPKLQWLLFSSVSPGMGRQRHFWLKGSATSSNNRARRFLEELYPHMSDRELDLMVDINTKEDLVEMAKKLGWDDRRIRDEL